MTDYVSKHMDISESPELLGAAESLMLFNGVPFSLFTRQAKALKNTQVAVTDVFNVEEKNMNIS